MRTLTYEELVDFHSAYYLPSNALITLYGDLQIEKFLEFIDRAYLSSCDKKEVEVDMGKIAPLTETQYAEYAFPVEQSASAADATVMAYSVALNGAGLYDTLAMAVLIDAITGESSPLMKVLRQKLPHAQINGVFQFDCPSAPFFAISYDNANPEDKDAFVAAVEEGFAALAAQGIPAQEIDAALAANKLALLTATEDPDLGVNASTKIALVWTYFDAVDYYPTYAQVIDDMTPQSADALIQKYITGNLHRAVSVTKPVAGLAEANAAALRQELAEKKNALSPEEIDALVQRSAEFVEWSNVPVSEEILSPLVNMRVEDLPEELRHYDITEEIRDGVRYLSAAVELDDVFAGEVLLDGSTLPIERLQDVQIFLSLIGDLDTAFHSKEELSTLLGRYLNGLSATLTARTGFGGADGLYAAKISWMGLGSDAGTAMALLEEILFETDFSDTDTIKNLLTRRSDSFSAELDESPLSVQIRRLNATNNDYSAYIEHVNDYALYAHERELIALADADPAALAARLKAAGDLLLNKADAIVACAGSQDAIDAYKAALAGVFANMPNRQREKVDYSSLRLPKRNEGIVNNSTVNMNILYSDYTGYSGKDIVATSLIDDNYLIPILLNTLGAYGAYSQLVNRCSYLYTYRDPNLAGSYEIFAALPQYLRTADLTQEMVDSYVIGSYSGLSRPAGLLSGALSTIENHLVGLFEETELEWMRQAKATTVADIASYADTWEKLIESSVRSSSGSESTLLAASDLFDVLIYPDGTVKGLAPSRSLQPAA